jgi:hypothetical protein
MKCCTVPATVMTAKAICRMLDKDFLAMFQVTADDLPPLDSEPPPALVDLSATYTSEKEYVAYLKGCLSTWLILTENVRALHYSGKILKYDLLAVPRTPEIAKHCQFPFFAIEVKYHLFDKKLKDISEAYMQAFEYRNTIIVDKRFIGTEMYEKRPGAVCLCSDYDRKWNSPETHVLSRTLGRRGVYGMWANQQCAIAFTDHGDVFRLAARGWSMTAGGHTALTFSSGIPDWHSLRFILSNDKGMEELTEHVREHYAAEPPPITPEQVLDRVVE